MATFKDWEPSRAECHRRGTNRAPLMTTIHYHASEAHSPSDLSQERTVETREGDALTLNISSGGMLLMMDWEPEVNRVIRVDVPSSVNLARIPTLAEVRWKRRSPYCTDTGVYFVGLSFVF